MAYSIAADVLTGDMLLGTVDPEKYVDAAAAEMDSKLGFVYALPLAPDGGTYDDLPEVEKLLLADINNKIATGRLILAQYVGGEDTSQHAYGLALLKEGLELLMMLANGVITLSAVPADTSTAVDSRVPSVVVYDEESMVTAFEKTVLGRTLIPGGITFAQPGEAP